MHELFEPPKLYRTVEKQKLTIDRIAKLAYVSRSVVSRVLNNRPNVSDEARARVMKVIKEYDYTPNATARSLATDRTNEISILAPRKDDEVFANGFWSLLFLGISEQSLRRNYFVSLSMVTLEMEDDLNDRILYGHSFDGYILITREVAGLVLPAIRRRDKPTVLIGHDPDFPDVNSVDVDNFDGAYQATRHLLELGYRHIAAIGGTPGAQESQDRLAGYKRAHEEANVPVSSDCVFPGDFSQKSGYLLMQKILSRTSPQSLAVLCANDAMATGALLAIHQAGLSIPEDVAVVGYDDLPSSQYTYPPLTTVRQPIYQMGEKAANIVIDQLEGEQSGIVHELLKAELIVRETCGAKLVMDG